MGSVVALFSATATAPCMDYSHYQFGTCAHSPQSLPVQFPELQVAIKLQEVRCCSCLFFSYLYWNYVRSLKIDTHMSSDLCFDSIALAYAHICRTKLAVKPWSPVFCAIET